MSLRAFVLALSLLLLGGCAGPGMVKSPLNESIADTDGTVIVAIAHAKPIDRLHVQATGAGKARTPNNANQDLIIRRTITDAGIYTSLFIGALPPGEYYVVQIDMGAAYVRLKEHNQERIGTFKVEAGKVTDLGSLGLTRAGLGYALGRLSDKPSNREFLQQNLPEYLAKIGAPVLSWPQPKGKNDLVEDIWKIKLKATTPIIELNNGQLVRGTVQGAVLVRQPQGRWKKIPGLKEAVLAVADLPNDGLLAGGELKSLVKIDKDGKTESVDTTGLPVGDIVYLRYYGQQGLLAAVRKKDAVKFFKTRALDKPEWKQSGGDIAIGKGFGTPTRVLFQPLKGKLAVAATQDVVALYDPNADKWTTHKTPFNLWDMSTAAGRWTLLRGPGLGKNFVSDDGGQTWKPVETRFRDGVAYFVDANTAYVQSAEIGMQIKPILRKTTDGGTTWETVGEMKGGQLYISSANQMFSLDDGELIGIESIYASKDEGKTWNIEYSNFVRGVDDQGL